MFRSRAIANTNWVQYCIAEDWLDSVNLFLIQYLPHHDKPTHNSAPCYSGCFFFGNIILVSALVVDDRKSKVMDSVFAAKRLCSKIPQMNRFDICDRIKVPWQFKVKYIYNKIIFGGQWTKADNIPTQVYLVIVWIRTILITNSNYIDCRKAIFNKHSLWCSDNCLHITY